MKSLLKDEACGFLQEALILLEKFCSTHGKDLYAGTNSVKHQMIESQNTIIKLQSELLDGKNEQLQMLQHTVKSSVDETVKAELKSYIATLTGNAAANQKTISPETIKQVVQSVVQEEDRSTNLLIFGLPEQAEEQLESVVGEVFLAIGEKPRVEACRLGKRTPGKKTRPVKVTAASSTVVNHVLTKCRDLRISISSRLQLSTSVQILQGENPCQVLRVLHTRAHEKKKFPLTRPIFPPRYLLGLPT